MINKIDYSFVLGYHPSLTYDVPMFNVLNLKEFPSECLIDLELNQLSGEDVREIVEELKEVKEGKKGDYSFGFETTSIEIYKVGYKNEYLSCPEGKVFISYNYGDNTLETDLKIEQILKMMIDWSNYINNWEKETEKVYEGI